MKTRVKTQIKQTVVQGISFITTVIMGMALIIMFSSWSTDVAIQDAAVEEGYHAEKNEDVKMSGPKYTLQDPEDALEENITSEVTEDSVTQKSNRLEDVMDVLSSETE